jgi:hypothetical protein
MRSNPPMGHLRRRPARAARRAAFSLMGGHLIGSLGLLGHELVVGEAQLPDFVFKAHGRRPCTIILLSSSRISARPACQRAFSYSVPSI